MAKLSRIGLHCAAFTPQVASRVCVIRSVDLEASKKPLEVYRSLVRACLTGLLLNVLVLIRRKRDSC